MPLRVGAEPGLKALAPLKALLKWVGWGAVVVLGCGPGYSWMLRALRHATPRGFSGLGSQYWHSGEDASFELSALKKSPNETH